MSFSILETKTGQIGIATNYKMTLDVAAALIPMVSAATLRAWLGRNKKLFPPKYEFVADNTGRGKVHRILTEDEVLAIRGLVILHDRVRAPYQGAPRGAPKSVAKVFGIEGKTQ